MRVLPPFRIAVSTIACALLLAGASAAQQETQAPFPAHPSNVDRAAAAGWGKGTWLDQHERCKATAQRGGIDLVLLGDSITQGFGAWRTTNMGIRDEGVRHLL